MDAERGCLARERAGILDDQRVRQGRVAERFGKLAERGFVGHRERDDDRRRVTGGFARGVGCLGDLRTMGEVSPDQRVEDLGRGGVGRSRRAFALTVDALQTSCVAVHDLSRIDQPLIVRRGHIRATRRAIAASSTVCTTGVMSL